MNALRRVFTRLVYGGTRKLRPHERACLDVFARSLTPATRSLFESQLAAVNLVQRFSEDKLVAFHFLDGQSPALLPSRQEDLLAGRLLIRNASGDKLRCDVMIHKGRLSSLEFSRPPKNLPDELTVEKVDVFADLSQEREADSGPVGARIPEELERLKLANVASPASNDAIERFLRQLSTTPPDDYVGVLRATDGFTVGGWSFLGTKARRIVREGQNLWLVAESAEKALAFQEDDTTPRVMLYDHIDDDCVDVGDKFVRAFAAATSSTSSVPIG